MGKKKEYTEASNIDEIIQVFDLKSKDRHVPKIYRRAYLYHVLNRLNYTLNHIGKLFDRNHATILHGLRVHESLYFAKDKLYLMYMDELDSMLIYDYEKIHLYQDVMKCRNMKELKIIKERIERNYYL
jgi:hypothetical protein